MKKLIPLACLILAGCVSSKYVSPSLNLAQPPAELVAPCYPPVTVTASTAREVETQWKQDRAALGACGYRHQHIVEWYAKRDAELVQ